MSTISLFHHFKGNKLTPSEKVEKEVIKILINSPLPDSKRETSIIFEIKHSTETGQIAKLLAQKRNLNIGLATVSAILHDIHVAVNGDYKNHARNGEPIARKILKKVGGFNLKDIELICNAVANHSDKHVYSDNPYAELVKDADVFACSFYRNSGKEYERIKTKEQLKHYTARVKKVRKELNLQSKSVFL
jgi:uncharacterized protein